MSKSCLFFFVPSSSLLFPKPLISSKQAKKLEKEKNNQPKTKQTNQKNTPGIWELPGFYRKHSQPDLKDGGGDEMTLRQEFSNPLGLTSPNPSLQQVGLALAIKEWCCFTPVEKLACCFPIPLSTWQRQGLHEARWASLGKGTIGITWII